MRTLIAGAMSMSLLFGGYAFAQEKKAGKAPDRVQKVLVDSDAVRVTESTYPPGAMTAPIQPMHRVTRAIKGGTLVRTYADGKKENTVWKTGEAREQPAASAPYTLSNPGKSAVVLYTVSIKQKK
jgi:hypothetical protein